MRLLLVEDEKKVADFVARGLRAERYAVDVAYDGTTGWEKVSKAAYDLVILDLMLPGLNGTELLRRFRRQGGTAAVLVLTARDGTEEKVQNFEAGADDYLTKPFAFAELLVRVKALLRRPPTLEPHVLHVADLEVDRLSKEVRRAGQRLELTSKEYSLLEYLASHAGQTLSRTMIVEHVWDQSFENLTNIVDVYVRYLRAKVDDPFPAKLIHTVRGAGYVLADEPKIMNTHSLRFQLIGWYAGLLVGCFGLLAVVTYTALQKSLVGSLRENQLRRARQVAQLLRENVDDRTESRVGEEIERRYSPGLNDRLIRVARNDNVVLYLSRAPGNQSFDPAALPPPVWATGTESSRSASLLGGRKMLLTAHKVQAANGTSYLVETGAPMDEVQNDLRKWLLFLLALFPAVALIALAGGYILVKRSLTPVDRITASAERITSQNLSERLPVPETGDELQRLSVALNRMIERLDAAFRHSRRFVADASHELRTPLTVLKGELESLLRGPELETEWRERLGTALEEVDRLANIVEGLFAISRLDAGEAAVEWVSFDLAQLAADTADQMALLAEDKAIEVTCAADRGVWVKGDRSRMKQVVVNLLDNAINYTPGGGAIGLSVSAQSHKAVLEVTDNGIGIPPQILPHVFERFYRVDKARSRERGGAGLGLSIVRSICTAHGGQVEAQSTPGQGSCFRVELPLSAVPANHHEQQSHHEHSRIRANESTASDPAA